MSSISSLLQVKGNEKRQVSAELMQCHRVRFGGHPDTALIRQRSNLCVGSRPCSWMSGRVRRYARSSATTWPSFHQCRLGRREVSMFRRRAALLWPPISRMPCPSHGASSKQTTHYGMDCSISIASLTWTLQSIAHMHASLVTRTPAAGPGGCHR